MCVHVFFKVIQESEKNDSTNIITMNIKFYQIQTLSSCVCDVETSASYTRNNNTQ